MIPINAIKKVLIIRPDAIGDMVLTLPCIEAIKTQYPQWHLTVLASPYNAQIIRHIPYIDNILLDWKKSQKITSIWDRIRYIRHINSHQFDLAIHFYSETDTVWTSVLARIPYHIGDTAKIGLWPVFRKHGVFLKTFDQTKHVMEYNFQLLRSIGIKLDPNRKMNFPIPPEYKNKGQDLLTAAGRRPNVPLIGIQLGVGFGNRALEPEKYADYINLLRTEIDIDVCVTPYSEKEKVFAARFANRVKTPVITIPDNSIPDFMGIISNYTLFVSVDTGPCHLCTAIGIPILAIFPSRKVKPTRWAPWRNRHFIVRESQTCDQFCPHEGCPLTICSDAIEMRDMVDKTKALISGQGLETAEDQFKEWFSRSMSVLILDSPETTVAAAKFESVLAKANIRVTRVPVTIGAIDELLLQKDVTIIHNFSGRRRLYLSFLARKAALQLFNPPLIIHSAWEIDESIPIENRYRTAFEAKVF